MAARGKEELGRRQQLRLESVAGGRVEWMDGGMMGVERNEL